MARLPRLSLAGHPHLVVQRGHNGAPVVRDDDDRQAWRDLLAEALATEHVRLHAWALRDSGFALLLTPPTASALAAALQSLGRRYVATFNRRHGRSGTLWDGRYRSCLVEPGPRLLACMLHVEWPDTDTHPAGAEQVQPDRWTSLAHHLGLAQDPLVQDPPAYWALGNTPFERQAAYRRLLEQGLPSREPVAIEQAVRRGWPIGGAEFLAAVAAVTGRDTRPRPRGRPRRSGPPAALP